MQTLLVEREKIAQDIRRADREAAARFALYPLDRKRLTAEILAQNYVLNAVRDFDPIFGRFSRRGMTTASLYGGLGEQQGITEDFQVSVVGCPSKDRVVYGIDYRRERFGRLYVSSDGSALAWKGSVALDRAEEEIADLSQIIVGNRGAVETKTIFILENEEDVSSEAVLLEPERISFARFDVTTTTDDRYSLTTENQKWLNRGISESGLKLHGELQWTPELLEWILQHHTFAQDLRSVSPHRLAGVLEKLTVTQQVF